MALLGILTATVLALAAPAGALDRRVGIVVGAGEPMKSAIYQGLMRAAPSGVSLSLHEFDSEELANPIHRGRLLAGLANTDLLVTIGDSATGLVLGEFADMPVYFVGASVLKGEYLVSPLVSGVLSYEVEGLLDAASSLWSGKLGVAFTPGYERIVETIRSGAKAHGLSVETKKITSAREIPSALQDLLDGSQFVWIVGDPLLVRGAGFQFAAERSLSVRVPLVASGPWEVHRGAFMAGEANADALASEAASGMLLLLGSGMTPSTRVKQAPPGQQIVVNGPLAGRWNVRLPAEKKWRVLR